MWSEAGIKTMYSAARLAHADSNGKHQRIATRNTLGSNHRSNVLPSSTPNYSVMFSAGRASTEMDPFAKKLRGSIAARASVVSSRERSAATEGDENNNNSIS